MSVLKFVKNIDTVNHVYEGQTITPGSYYEIQKIEETRWMSSSSLLADIGSGKAMMAKTNDGQNDISDVNDQIVFLRGEVPVETADKRPIVAINRIPAGYTVYPTGVADDISNGTFGGGTTLHMNKTDGKSVDFQMLEHYYAIGGRAMWEDAGNRDNIEAKLWAPKTVGTNSTGDFTKVEVAPSSGLYIFVPTAPGAGDWSLDLTEKLTNTNILKCTPVPSPGNQGFFDYNSDTNVLTVNTQQKGGYNLCDWDVNLFAFCRSCWGRKDNGETALESTDVVGKLLYNSWKIKFTLSIHDESNRDPKVSIVMVTAAQKNI